MFHDFSIRRFMLVMLTVVSSLTALVQAQEQPIDEVAQQELWQQPDFVRAYYVVAEPGGALYSIFGHACLHMVCPAYGLDYFFSYESEGVTQKLFKFLAGNLHMGMIGLTAEEYLSEYRAQGRGVKEYEFNLPIDKKRELWRVLDAKMGEGINLPYDFEARGCAYSCVVVLEEALGDSQIEYSEWSPRFNRTRREMGADMSKLYFPWNLMCVTSLVGYEFDKVDTITEKLIIPYELAEVWQCAKVDGEYLLSRDAHELLPSTQKPSAPWFTPMVAALLLMVLAIAAWFICVPYIDWLMLVIVTAIGAVITYMVVFSTLPCTSWNWLIIPFNILPAIGWHWRRYWSQCYAVVIGAWIAAMLVSPHQLVDYSMLVLAGAFILILLNKRNIN